jgi:hypothetical protein
MSLTNRKELYFLSPGMSTLHLPLLSVSFDVVIYLYLYYTYKTITEADINQDLGLKQV